MADRADIETISGPLVADLSNAVSDAMIAAMRKGMSADEAACVVAGVAADYWRVNYGPGRLDRLALIVTDRVNYTLPDGSGTPIERIGG